MLRRQFLLAVGMLISVINGKYFKSEKSLADGGLRTALPAFKRVFRCDGTGWKEIAWEEMRQGDQIIMVEGHVVKDYLYVALWTVDKIVPAGINGPWMSVVLSSDVSLLPSQPVV